jgi:hypothetical protein
VEVVMAMADRVMATRAAAADLGLVLVKMVVAMWAEVAVEAWD